MEGLSFGILRYMSIENNTAHKKRRKKKEGKKESGRTRTWHRRLDATIHLTTTPQRLRKRLKKSLI